MVGQALAVLERAEQGMHMYSSYIGGTLINIIVTCVSNLCYDKNRPALLISAPIFHTPTHRTVATPWL